MSLALEAVDLAQALQAARRLVEPASLARGIDIDMRVETGLHVLADPRRLQQVLLNVLSNAIKYNRVRGSLRCTVGSTPARQGATADATRAVLVIEDTGEGLSADELQRLFQPFERLGRETSDIEGSGLGLVISRALVQEMHGSLTMTSEPGVGSRVCIELPLTTAAPLPPLVPGRPQGPSSAPLLRMLYVEDNRLNALLFEEAIKLRGGIELRIVDDGPDAIELLHDWHADVLVLDAHLPTMSGYEVLSRLRQVPRFADTPAFMCSADALPDELQRAREAGFAGYWSKPIDIAQVMRDLDALPAPPAAAPQ
jgi:CheY-like chemotaxis protein